MEIDTIKELKAWILAYRRNLKDGQILEGEEDVVAGIKIALDQLDILVASWTGKTEAK